MKESIVIDGDFLRSVDIHEVLPQQEPFVMVGTLTQFENSLSATQTLIREDNIFVDEGYFSSSGLMCRWDLSALYAILWCIRCPRWGR